MNTRNVFPCSLCESEESLDFENLKTHLHNFHNILQTQKQTFLLALIVVEFDHDDILQKLMTEMQERVEGMLSSEEREEQPGETLVDVQDDDDIREDLKEEILKQTETYDVDNIQQKIREDLDSDEEDGDDVNDPGGDPLEPTVMVTIKEEPRESPEQSFQAVPEEVNRLNLYEKFKKMNLCRLCYSKCENEEALKKHEEEEHSDDQEALGRTHFTLQDLIHKCSVCPKIAFLTQNLVIKHEERQHKIKRRFRPLKGITCKLCYKVFKKEQLRLVHYDSVHRGDPHLDVKIGDEDLKYPCSDCSYRFVSESLLRSHQLASHELNVKSFYDIKTKSYKCKLCHISFNYPFKIIKHINSYHSGDKKILKNITEDDYVKQCDKCDLKFISEKLMDFHRLKVHFPTEKKIPCSICGKNISRYNVSAHKSLIHSDKPLKDPKPIAPKVKKDSHSSLRSGECHICFTTIKNKYQLPKHMKNVHMRYRSYWNKKIPEAELLASCKECNKSLLNESLLDIHMRVVHRIKITSGNCPLCHKTLQLKNNLKPHLSKMHQQEKEFWFKEIPMDALHHSCQDCSSKFVSKRCLDIHISSAHMKVISETQCHLCLKTITEGKMKHHLRITHIKESQYWFKQVPDEQRKVSCPDCSNRFVSTTSLKLHKTASHEKRITTFDFLRKPSFSVDTKKFTCKLCLKSYLAWDNLKNHFNKVHQDDIELLKKETIEEEDLKFTCTVPDCLERFPAQSSLNYHKKGKHSLSVEGSSKQKASKFKKKKSKLVKLESKERYCQLCNILYKKPYFFQAHKKKIHSCELDAFEKEIGLLDLTHQCSKCFRSFYSENTLAYHHHVKHYTGKVTHCTLCDHDFKNPVKYSTHKYRVHKFELDLFKKELIENNFQQACFECPKKFLTKSSLDFHTKIMHKKLAALKKEGFVEKPKKIIVTFCKLCCYKFPDVFSLKRHKKKFHKSEEEIQAFNVKPETLNLKETCKFCNLKFLNSNCLRYHVTYKHKEERKGDVKCDQCNVTFKFSYNRERMIKNHMKNMHSVKAKTAKNQVRSQKNMTVENFMNFFNSLTQ